MNAQGISATLTLLMGFAFKALLIYIGYRLIRLAIRKELEYHRAELKKQRQEA